MTYVHATTHVFPSKAENYSENMCVLSWNLIEILHIETTNKLFYSQIFY